MDDVVLGVNGRNDAKSIFNFSEAVWVLAVKEKFKQPLSWTLAMLKRI